MAELTAGPAASPHTSTATRAPGTAAQLRAIAWLRWRILANGFRRKGGAGELIARILVLPVFAVFAIFPTLAAGYFSYTFTQQGTWDSIAWILWATFALAQLLNINLGQPGTTFDPVELIRFPMPLARFVLVRLLFGLLAPGNIIVSLISVAVLVGVSAAAPRLFLPALLAMAVFGLANILFTRMVFAWVDRWLSTRRARELFTAFIFLVSLGFQALNARFNPGFRHGTHHHHHAAGAPSNASFLLTLAHRAHPVLTWLPPNLTADALGSAAAGHPGDFFFRILFSGAYAALFLWIYTLRMASEFRGENLSEAATLTKPVTASKQTAAAASKHTPASGPLSAPLGNHGAAATGWLPPTLAPLLGKELLVLRRNTGLFYGLVAPAVMVFLFAGRIGTRNSFGSHWVLLAAVAYALLGVAPLGFNALGLEGTGAQFYFMAPVPLREVFFAKNVFTLSIAFAEAVLVIAITAYVAGRPSLGDCLFVLLWALGTFLLLMLVGNRRSLAAPRKVNPGRTMKKTQSPLSAYISIAIMLACTGFGLGCELLAVYLDKTWIGLALMLAFVAGAALSYNASLDTLEAYALEHRDTLFEELGKKI